MAILYISEYNSQTIGGDLRGSIAAGGEPSVAEQAVTEPGVSAAYNSKTFLVRLVSDTDCWLSFGANPSPQTATHWLPARVIEYKGVNPGDKIAVSN